MQRAQQGLLAFSLPPVRESATTENLMSHTNRKLRADAGVARKSEYRRRKIPLRVVSFRCRCSHWHCQARRTLRKHPSLYARQPRCACGAPLRIDYYRTLKETSRARRDCGAAHYPHRRGWCEKVQSRNDSNEGLIHVEEKAKPKGNF